MPSNAVSNYAQHKFGKATATPQITGVYAGAGGWQPVGSKINLTEETAQEMRDQGITMVRVRWRFQTHEIILRRYLGG